MYTFLLNWKVHLHFQNYLVFMQFNPLHVKKIFRGSAAFVQFIENITYIFIQILLVSPIAWVKVVWNSLGYKQRSRFIFEYPNSIFNRFTFWPFWTKPTIKTKTISLFLNTHSKTVYWNYFFTVIYTEAYFWYGLAVGSILIFGKIFSTLNGFGLEVCSFTRFRLCYCC